MSRDIHGNKTYGGQTGNKQSVRVQARQRNHEDYRLPVSLSHLPSVPLYLAVAHLGILMQEPLTRQAIGLAFGISTRRALEVMRYLINGKSGVICERLPPLSGQSALGYRIHIHALSVSESRDERSAVPARDRYKDVNDTSLAEAGATRMSKPRSREGREQACQALRRWFLQRPNPDAIR